MSETPLAMVFVVPNVDKTYHCRRCGQEWVRPQSSAFLVSLRTRCPRCRRLTWHEAVQPTDERPLP